MIANVILKVYLMTAIVACVFFAIVAFDYNQTLIGGFLLLVAIVTSIVLKWIHNNTIQ